jgi:hypothetical protein
MIECVEKMEVKQAHTVKRGFGNGNGHIFSQLPERLSLTPLAPSDIF